MLNYNLDIWDNMRELLIPPNYCIGSHLHSITTGYVVLYTDAIDVSTAGKVRCSFIIWGNTNGVHLCLYFVIKVQI